MKVIKIGAIWCSGCLIMNKIWNKVLENYNFSYEVLDLDMDEEEVSKYNVGDTLPVFIILSNDVEVNRFSGEYKYEEFVNKLIEVGVINEENN